MKAIMAVLVMAVLVMGSGCASIMSQTHYPVSINSTPPGATVTVRDIYGQNVLAATTPTVATLSASAGYFIPARYTFTFEKQGFQPAYAVIEAYTDPWYFMNIFELMFCPIGFLFVDPVTGAMWELNRSVGANLAPLAPGQAQPVAVTPTVSTTTVSAPVVYTPAPVYVPPPVFFPPMHVPFPHP